MLIDTHAHIDAYPAALVDRAIAETERLGILTLSVTASPRDFIRLQPLTARSPLIVPCFGLHPRHAQEYVHNLEPLIPFIHETAIVGEIGLDYGLIRDPRARAAQRTVFEFCLSEAQAAQKLVSVHSFGASRKVLELLNRYRVDRSIFHWYSGSLDLISAIVESGGYLSVGFEVTVSKHIQDIARAVPAERLLTETDNPHAQSGLAGSVGMPNILERIILKIAQLRKVSPAEIEQLVQTNFERLLGTDPACEQIRQVLQGQPAAITVGT
jgi:TatD DNase family protein